MRYRPDIDGLRGIAVSLVVAFHAGIPGFQGGFVGVDVFFVISGYLIAAILLKELRSTGAVDFWSFYAKRVRRLFPALAVVLVSSMVIACLMLSPFGQLQSFSKSAIFGAIFLANFHFAQTTGGYFDAPSELTPLLHLWSLAVEEQFYLVFPLLLLIIWRVAGVRRVGMWLVIIGAISMAYALWATAAMPQQAYFSPLARAWQLLAGALIACFSQHLNILLERGGRASSRLLSVAGVTFLAVGVTVSAGEVPYPGWRAFLPTFGSVLLISAGVSLAMSATLTVLRWPLLVYVGRISYPWYLWHWPLISLAKAHRLAEPSLPIDLMMAALSFALAAATYHLIERPAVEMTLRRRTRALPMLGTGAVGMALVVGCAGLLGLTAKRHPDLWYDAKYAAAAGDRSPLRRHCHQDHPYQQLADAGKCRLGAASGEPLLYAWGDSHADHWFPLLAHHRSEAGGLVVSQRSFSACPPWLGDAGNLSGARRDACDRFSSDVLNEITMEASRGRPVGVLMGRYWIGDGLASSATQTFQRRRDAVLEHLGQTLDVLGEADVRVLLVEPTPTLPLAGIECLARRGVDECSTEAENYNAQRQQVGGVLSQLAADREWVRVLNVAETFCDAKQCFPERDGTVLIWDRHHLTGSGARAVYTKAKGELCWLTGLHDCDGAS